MGRHVDIYLHHGGKWVMDLELSYVGGNFFILDDFNVDLMSITTIKDVYKKRLGYNDVQQVHFLEPGLKMNEGLFLVEDSEGIRKVLNKINHDTNVIEFFANHEINEPFFAQEILTISSNPLGLEDEANNISSEYDGNGRVDKLNEHDDDSFMASEEIGSGDDADNEDIDEICVDDQGPYFTLGMTFSSAIEVREFIAQYSVSRGVPLKYVKNEPSRIRVKCEDGCPFLLLVSKDGSNPGLTVKTLIKNHNCSGVFNNPRCSTSFLAKQFKNKILEKLDYKVKDLKKDVEEELRVKIGYAKCKRVRRMVLDEHKKMSFREREFCDMPKVEKRNVKPKTKRRDANEPKLDNFGPKSSKKGNPVTCSLCKKQGHNKATCKKDQSGTPTPTLTTTESSPPQALTAASSPTPAPAATSSPTPAPASTPSRPRPSKLEMRSAENNRLNSMAAERDYISTR